MHESLNPCNSSQELFAFCKSLSNNLALIWATGSSTAIFPIPIFYSGGRTSHHRSEGIQQFEICSPNHSELCFKTLCQYNFSILSCMNKHILFVLKKISILHMAHQPLLLLLMPGIIFHISVLLIICIGLRVSTDLLLWMCKALTKFYQISRTIGLSNDYNKYLDAIKFIF